MERRPVTIWLVALGAAIAFVIPEADGDAGTVRGTVGGDFRVSGPAATSDEAEVAVAHNPDDDQFLVVWRDNRNGGTTGWDIYGQRLSASGARVGPNFRITGAAATGLDWLPDVAYSSASHQYFVVWQGGRDVEARGSDIYLQRVSRSGARLGGNVQVSGPVATGDEAEPAVAASASGGALVVWMDERNAASRDIDIYGQRVSAGGARLGGNFRISGGGATSADLWPDVAFNTVSGEYLVVWQDFRDAPTRGSDVYAQRVTPGGMRVGGNLRVTGAMALANTWEPSVSCGDHGGCLVAWEDFRNTEGGSTDVYAQRVSAGGARLGGNLRVSGGAAVGNDEEVDVSYEPVAGRFLVVWRDGRSIDTRSSDIYAQWVALTGIRVGANLRVSGAMATGFEASPAAACRASGSRCLTVRTDGRDEGTRGDDVYGRGVTP